jgi:chromosome segregation ATPase
MELNQFVPLLITFVFTMVGSYITIKITIAEIKKDISFLKDKLESELVSKAQAETQAKDDMKEVKDELKMIFKSINEIQINLDRMEERSEGKDEVIGELKDAVTTILKQR